MRALKPKTIVRDGMRRGWYQVCIEKKVVWFLVGIAALAPLTSRAQEATMMPRLSTVVEAVKPFIDGREVAGAVTLVADADSILHLDAAGKADIANQHPMTHDSIFWIASMSKPITGACVMILQDEGKLSLDDPIAKYLPEMKELKLPDGRSAVITLRHLLTHTSGMAELKADQAYTSRNLEEAASRYAQVAVLFEPGSKWQYSQTSINTAARIVEVVSKMPFDEFVEQRICRPLGMKDTTFYLTPTQLPRLAKSYQRSPTGVLEETQIKLLAGKSPSDRDRMPAANGGLFSTARDYARFCQMLLRGGEWNGQRVLSEKGVTTMRTIATGDLVTGFTPGNGWGIGCCVIRDPIGVTAILSPGSFGHGGAYGTQAWIDPVRNRIHILMIQRSNLGNSDGSDLRRVFHESVARGLDGSQAFLGQGCMSGEVTDRSVFLQTRLTATNDLDADLDIPGKRGVVRFEWCRDGDWKAVQHTDWLTATAERDFIVRHSLSGLEPNTRYTYRALYGPDPSHLLAGPLCHFKTLPSSTATDEVHFVMASCMNYNKFLYGKEAKASGPVTATEQDKQLGFPAFVAIQNLRPDFFIGTGDIVYYDNVKNGPAQSLPELRQCWHEQFRFPRLKEFFERTPAYWSKDDHDFRFDDSDLRSEKLPLPQTGIELFREQMPILAAGDNASPTFRTHRLNKYAQLWFSEGRDYRSPNKMPDGPEKSLWGKEQREWLQRTLKESDAKWKILITPTPMVGPDDARKTDNHTNLGGFRHEANEFFAWLRREKIGDFFTCCGDRHWQYHSRHPSGVEEFACGALNDENSRHGVKPGSKNGTDPEGLIEQLYIHSEPTGGFLHIVAGERLRIEFRDDGGDILHMVEK